MSKVSLRRLLSKLTAIALTTSVATPIADAATADVSIRVREDDVDFDAELQIDREHLDADDAAITLGRSLALALSEMRPLSATYLAASWTLSPDRLRRLAVGHSLAWAFPLVGDALAIDHLSRDPDPAIRIVAARAAWVRRATGGDLGVLARLADDPDPAVRAIAASAR